MSLKDPQLEELFGVLLGYVSNPEMPKQLIISAIQAIGITTCAVGTRAGKFVDTAVPLITMPIETATEEDIELLESCIRTLESFMSCCTRYVQPYLQILLDICIKYLHFDPNYADDGDDDENMDFPSEEEEEDPYTRSDFGKEPMELVFRYSDEEAYSDDEDESWKVRRASASGLTTIFAKYPEEIPQIYENVCSAFEFLRKKLF